MTHTIYISCTYTLQNRPIIVKMVSKLIYNKSLMPLPSNAEQLNNAWQINVAYFSGCLYKIKIKGDDFVNELGQMEEAPTYELPFKPNEAQERF